MFIIKGEVSKKDLIREIEKADTKFIDNNIERIMSSSGNISNILDLLNLKRNNYKDNSNVLVMVG